MTIKYDRKEVIQKAMNLFWEKGFHATSMRNLQEVIDMRPGSIYAGFDGKEGLFREALEYYTEMGLAQLAVCAEESPSPLEAVKTVIINMATDSSSPSGMCMLVKSIAELTENNADLLSDARRLLHKVESALATLLTQAKECGELDASKDPERMARFLQLQLMGLRAYACANNGNVKVDELLEDILSYLH